MQIILAWLLEKGLVSNFLRRLVLSLPNGECGWCEQGCFKTSRPINPRHQAIDICHADLTANRTELHYGIQPSQRIDFSCAVLRTKIGVNHGLGLADDHIFLEGIDLAIVAEFGTAIKAGSTV